MVIGDLSILSKRQMTVLRQIRTILVTTYVIGHKINIIHHLHNLLPLHYLLKNACMCTCCKAELLTRIIFPDRCDKLSEINFVCNGVFLSYKMFNSWKFPVEVETIDR